MSFVAVVNRLLGARHCFCLCALCVSSAIFHSRILCAAQRFTPKRNITAPGFKGANYGSELEGLPRLHCWCTGCQISTL